MILVWLILLLQSKRITGYLSNMNYVPIGTNPTLYKAGHDPVMQLDASTFVDTILKQDHAFVVQFYADWCGHCRNFAPHFLQFALSIRPWKSVVTVGAINCGDSVNQKICSNEGIIGYPMILYYPRFARHRVDAVKLEPKESLSQMRSQLTQVIRNEYNQFHYADWPDFTFLTADSAIALKSLWNARNDSRQFFILLFEQFDGIGIEFLLDMLPTSAKMLTRRVIIPSPAIQTFSITHLPYILIFKRSETDPIYQSPYGSHSLQEIMQITHTVPQGLYNNVTFVSTSPVPSIKQQSIVQCDLYQDRCRALYYVSETDMLKAMRMALLDEVVKTDEDIAGEKFTALFDFISILVEYFPIYTSVTTPAKRSDQKMSTVLKNSMRAKSVFSHLQRLLGSYASIKVLPAAVWQNQFRNIERVYGYPFPTNASWEHCKGTSPGYRGYTCGLWTTFHALTVSAFMQGSNSPIRTLSSIREWVTNFFGCLDCRRHFLHMTTILYPLTEQRVKTTYDAMFYLWRAHNIVNARLHDDKATEDPQFQKRQFPPVFLCSICHSNGMFRRKNVRDFLVNYYSTIKPYSAVIP
ncbi:unnamed protein product [Thelazia callipaeda]|uniref:Sulfhydryl oxidase n=1 Tax=Thelazia callipaeda TaxID=103827 RepID=A0A158RAL4_THECL|nr:unnamed protein product [Thelazia callipaeda]